MDFRGFRFWNDIYRKSSRQHFLFKLSFNKFLKALMKYKPSKRVPEDVIRASVDISGRRHISAAVHLCRTGALGRSADKSVTRGFSFSSCVPSSSVIPRGIIKNSQCR